MKATGKFLIFVPIFAVGFLTAQCGSANGTEPNTADAQTVADAQAVKNVEVVSPDDFAKRLVSVTASGVQLLDVRTPAEQRQGVIEGARLLDFSKRDVFVNGIDQLDKNQPVLVYCAVGGRSAMAARMLAERGFRQIVDLDGGMDAWTRSGHHTVQPHTH